MKEGRLQTYCSHTVTFWLPFKLNAGCGHMLARFLCTSPRASPAGACLQDKFVDTHEVDLVFLEYSLNDGYVVSAEPLQ